MLFRSIEDKKYRIKETDCKEFWLPILKMKTFQDYIKNKYQIATGDIINDDVDGTFDIETTNGAE